MKKIYTFIALCVLMFANNCKQESLIIIEGVETVSFGCLIPITENQVINSLETYELFFNQNKDMNQTCVTYLSPQIDFTEKTLLGQYIEVTACGITTESEVFADPEQNQYIYQLKVNMQGECSTSQRRLIWISVPKLPDNYTVTFEAIYERI